MINDRVLTMSQNTLRLSDLKSSSESRVTLEQTSDTGIFRPWNKIWMSSKSEIDWYQITKIISKICVKLRCLLDTWFALRSTKKRTRAKSKCWSFLWKISYDMYLRNETSWNSSRRSRYNRIIFQNRVDNVLDIIKKTAMKSTTPTTHDKTVTFSKSQNHILTRN